MMAEPFIFRLPPELLFSIFDHLAQDHFDMWYKLHFCGRVNDQFIQLSQRIYPVRPYAWVKVMGVCQAWRALAWHSPTLWRRVVVTHTPRVVEAVVARSGVTEITLACYVPPYTSVAPGLTLTGASLLCVLRHSHRIRTVSMRVAGTEDMGLLERAPGFRKLYEEEVDAPALRSLLIIAPDVHNNAPCEWWDMPALQRVVLRQLPSPQLVTSVYYMPFYQCQDTLTHFDYAYEQGISPFDAGDILRSLGEIPSITSLSLDLAPEVTKGTPRGRISLPQLRFLHIRGDIRACADLLCRLDLPGDVKLRLNCIHRSVKARSDVKTSDVSYQDTIQALADAFAAQERPPLDERVLTVQALPTGTVTLGWWHESDPRTTILLPNAAPLARLTSLFECIPLGKIKTIRFIGQSHLPSLSFGKLVASARRRPGVFPLVVANVETDNIDCMYVPLPPGVELCRTVINFI